MKNVIIALAVVVFIGLVFTWQVSIWNECRQTNSWGYCMQVLSK